MFILVPAIALALVSACGGSSDDDSDGPTQRATGTSDGAGGATSAATSGGGGGGENDIPVIKDGAFQSGRVHIEISGDRDATFDLDGNGIAAGGYALFSYGNSDASIQVALQAGADEEPGGLSITTADLATAGAWGEDCAVSVEESGSEVKGQFSCDDLDAIATGSTASLHLRVRGTFSAKR
jgi:hypothetical protein